MHKNGFLAFFLFVSLSASFCGFDPLPPSPPPTKYDFATGTAITLGKVERCSYMSPLQLEVNEVDGGYILHVVGKDLRLSSSDEGRWEKINFRLDVEPIGLVLVRVQMVGLRGKVAYSTGEKRPPDGSRWEPFDDQELALASVRMEPVYEFLANCCIDPVKICSCYKKESSNEYDDGRWDQTMDGEA